MKATVVKNSEKVIRDVNYVQLKKIKELIIVGFVRFVLKEWIIIAIFWVIAWELEIIAIFFPIFS
jgi:hypothetical protein